MENKLVFFFICIQQLLTHYTEYEIGSVSQIIKYNANVTVNCNDSMKIIKENIQLAYLKKKENAIYD